jgi:hypothetical protein
MQVSVNFDMALVCLLRETRYFKHFDKEIPASAEHLYTSDRTYRQVIINIINNILLECACARSIWSEGRCSHHLIMH